MSNAKNIFTGLPPWAQGVIAVSATAVTLYGVYLIHKTIKTRKALKGANAEKNAITKELNQMASKGQLPTLSKAQCIAIANQIHAAFDGYGTDNKAVLAAFTKAKNKADVLQIIEAYGVREISSGRYNPEPNFKGTLPAAITNEMPESGNGILNIAAFIVNPIAGLAAMSNGDIGIETINKVFATKKIDFQF